MFDTPVNLFLGLLTGFVFGFLLQKGRVAKFPVVLGQFLLIDWTVAKIMATAVAVGAIGVWTLVHFGDATLHIKPAQLGGVVIGGTVFGLGIAIFGYCPGTGVAACGEGHRDAMAGAFGMLTGAAVYVAAYSGMAAVAGSLGDFGRITLPMVSDTSPWIWVGGITLGAGVFIAVLESGRRTVRRRTTGREFPPAGPRVSGTGAIR